MKNRKTLFRLNSLLESLGLGSRPCKNEDEALDILEVGTKYMQFDAECLRREIKNVEK